MTLPARAEARVCDKAEGAHLVQRRPDHEPPVLLARGEEAHEVVRGVHLRGPGVSD